MGAFLVVVVGCGVGNGLVGTAHLHLLDKGTDGSDNDSEDEKTEDDDPKDLPARKTALVVADLGGVQDAVGGIDACPAGGERRERGEAVSDVGGEGSGAVRTLAVEALSKVGGVAGRAGPLVAVALRAAAGKHHAAEDGEDEDCEGLHDHKDKAEGEREEGCLSLFLCLEGVWQKMVGTTLNRWQFSFLVGSGKLHKQRHWPLNFPVLRACPSLDLRAEGALLTPSLIEDLNFVDQNEDPPWNGMEWWF